MFIHHLFGFNGFLVPQYNQWISVIPYGNQIALGCKLCIPLFSFVSGYGLYVSYINKSHPRKGIILKIVDFLIPFWLVTFFIAIPALDYLNKLNIRYLPVSLFALLHDDNMLYVSFTWYVKVYLEYLLVLPIIKKISNSIHNIWQEGFVFIVLPVAVSFFLPDSEDHFQGIVIWILSSLRILLVLLPSFHVGTIYGKYKLDISRLKIFSELRASLSSVLIALVGMAFSIIFIRAFMGYYQVYWIAALVFALSFDYIYKNFNLYPVKKILGFLGKYSYEYWLISGMFFLNTVEFQWILFIPRISILILIWAFIIMTPAVMLIQYISSREMSHIIL